MGYIDIVKNEYIKEILHKGIRDDGRKFMQYRSIRASVGTIPNAEGSAEVNIGNTKVLAGIKIDVDTPMPDKPEEGNLIVSAELLPLASPDYDIGPPSPAAIELARVVDRGIRAANILDTQSLFIEKDKVWSVFIDIYVLNYDGNLFDASTLSAVAALLHTRQPKYEEEKVIREGTLPKLKTNGMVTSCTFGKINGNILLDPDGSEESIMDTRLTIANDENNNIKAMQKGLHGTFSIKEVESMIDTTFEKSKDLRSVLSSLEN
ncbi:MAG: exosome complex protein Rrp42 [Candidatus Micrarchaeia archaeon]